jgi:hypothetical protein
MASTTPDPRAPSERIAGRFAEFAEFANRFAECGGRADPREEAFRRIAGRFDPRVLEPSPPSVTDAPWYADDPVAAEPGRRSDLPLLTPVPGGDLTWNDLAQREPALAPWCADRWLGPWHRLEPIPDAVAFSATRRALHDIAATVLSPAREKVNGKIGLRATYRGFGTPFFGRHEQLRVEGTNVVRVHDAAIIHVEPIDVDPSATHALAAWYGFAASVLEELRATDDDPAASPSRVQLWPEHFDMSVDLGDEPLGRRGTFGASPGDANHPEPYLYVTHWAPVEAAASWNETSFPGASMRYGAVLDAPDQRAAALEFFRSGREVLRQGR